MTAPDNAPRPPRYTAGQVAMVVVGVILLLPGACSLFFMIGMAAEFRWSDPITQMIVALWGFCLLISGGGVALILSARKWARSP